MSTIQNVVVRPFTAADLNSVRLLHQRLLPLHYPHSFFLQLLTQTNRICLIAHHPADPAPIAFVSAAMSTPSSRNNPLSSLCSPADLAKPRLEILTLGVLPSYRNLGLARLLITRLVDYFHESSSITEALIHANVSTSNKSAIKFYERIGMTVSPTIIRNLYTTLSTGSRDAYLVVGTL